MPLFCKCVLGLIGSAIVATHVIATVFYPWWSVPLVTLGWMIVKDIYTSRPC